MPEYSNAMFAHAWSIADNVSNDVPSMPPVNLSSIHWKKVPRRTLEGSQTTMEDQTCFVSLKIAKVDETSLGRLYRLKTKDPFADQINVDSTHPVLIRKVFGW